MTDQSDLLPAADLRYALTLYVAGQSPKSLTAFINLRRICEEYLVNRYSIEVVDVTKHSEVAIEHHILALPTLVRRMPKPVRKLIGDLSNTEKALVAMEIVPISP